MKQLAAEEGRVGATTPPRTPPSSQGPASAEKIEVRAGAESPDTATGAGLRQTLSWYHLVGITFFAVCGGDYGIEDAVGAAGPGLCLLGILLLPWIWSLPIALMTAELGSMIPEAGGYVVWVHRAFGPFWAHMNATWNLVSNTFDNALYPVMVRAPQQHPSPPPPLAPCRHVARSSLITCTGSPRCASTASGDGSSPLGCSPASLASIS